MINNQEYFQNQINSEEVNQSIEMSTITSGIVNSVRLSSLVKICDGINFYTTDTLMPQMTCPLKNSRYVSEGEIIVVNCSFKFRSELNEVQFGVI